MKIVTNTANAVRGASVKPVAHAAAPPSVVGTARAVVIADKAGAAVKAGTAAVAVIGIRLRAAVTVAMVDFAAAT
jgi:hypothetical protein